MKASPFLLGMSLALSAPLFAQQSLDPTPNPLSFNTLANRDLRSQGNGQNSNSSKTTTANFTEENRTSLTPVTSLSFASTSSKETPPPTINPYQAIFDSSNAKKAESSHGIQAYTYLDAASFQFSDKTFNSFSPELIQADNLNALSLNTHSTRRLSPLAAPVSSPLAQCFLLLSPDKDSSLEFGFRQLDSLILKQNEPIARPSKSFSDENITSSPLPPLSFQVFESNSVANLPDNLSLSF